MKIIMLWDQRINAYPNQYAPELLEAIDEHGDKDNPDFINNHYKDVVASGEFSSVQIIEAEVNDSKIIDILNHQSVELRNIEEFIEGVIVE